MGGKMVEIMWIGVFIFMVGQSRGIFGFSRSIFSEDDVKTKLKDVAGLDHQKQEVFEFVDFLKNREKYIEVGARMPRGALFFMDHPAVGRNSIGQGGCRRMWRIFFKCSWSRFF